MHPNWKALATVPINYIQFVSENTKASCSETKSKTPKPLESSSKCGQNSARDIYESIITESFDNPVIQRKKIKLTEKAENQKTSTPFNLNSFMKFAVNNDTKALESYLKEYPENVNVIDDFGWSALMCAIQAGSKEVIELLLKYGADISITDKSGNTALSLAISHKNNYIVNMLLGTSPKTYLKNTKNSVESFFCQFCNESFENTALKSHETSTLHLFNTKSTIIRPYFGIPVSNKGYQLLIRNGWNQNSGLGSSEDGRKYPIKTVIRKRRTGLGIEQEPSRVTHKFNNNNTNIEHKNKNHVRHYYSDRQKDKKFRSLLS
ncbi:G patch domain and ankyrin repeat-containing protein 1 homolog [Ctenocephalides felis]|uniref:G patch domain and ankyrin repeat-containing protein 1 homolog n=1 Tax=Ctenocephalides felis TaxID=7515 RepID=UPI000E6E34DE|nr:G patch domain and ankyrin repeat-containing protein 1 homolog [Ctenocephalides felis]